MGAIHIKRSQSHQTNHQPKQAEAKISNTYIFIFGTAMFSVFGIASCLELE
jgi:hypothetical protein